MADKPKWKEPCGCLVDEFVMHKICASHKKSLDAVHDIAVRDKAILDNWNTGTAPDHSRHGTFEKLGGPIKWDPYVAPNPLPEPVLVEGDLTSMMN